MLKNKNEKYSIDTENLAVPEVHTGKVEFDVEHEEEIENTKKKSSVSYDTLAVPEVHIRKKK